MGVMVMRCPGCDRTVMLAGWENERRVRQVCPGRMRSDQTTNFKNVWSRCDRRIEEYKRDGL